MDSCNTRGPDGKKWNAKTLSLAAGLSQNHVGQFRRGEVRGGQSETLDAIAKAAGVSTEWLVSGRGEPIAIDDFATIESPIDSAISAAYSHEKHTLKDLDAVRNVFRSTAFSIDPDTDLVEAARSWLNAAAKLRKIGQAVTTESLMVAVTSPKSNAVKAAELRSEIESQVASLGVDREKARALGAAIIAKFRKSFSDQ